VLPTVTDAKMRWRLEYARQVRLEWDKQHAAAIENARRLLSRTDLSRDQRESLQDRIAFNLTESGRYGEAVALMDELIAANDDRPNRQLKYLATKAWYLDAAARDGGDRTQATVAFERLRERCRPGSDDWETATWGLALQLQAAQRFREALALRRELVASNPAPELLLDLAETQASLGLFADALCAVSRVERWISERPASELRRSDAERVTRLTLRLHRQFESFSRRDAIVGPIVDR
jgi:tetratricopeptide (TPR) repeat protein